MLILSFPEFSQINAEIHALYERLASSSVKLYLWRHENPLPMLIHTNCFFLQAFPMDWEYTDMIPAGQNPPGIITACFVTFEVLFEHIHRTRTFKN